MCDENQKRSFGRKLEKIEICSELASIGEERNLEQPPPVIDIIITERTRKSALKHR